MAGRLNTCSRHRLVTPPSIPQAADLLIQGTSEMVNRCQPVFGTRLRFGSAPGHWPDRSTSVLCYGPKPMIT